MLDENSPALILHLHVFANLLVRVVLEHVFATVRVSGSVAFPEIEGHLNKKKCLITNLGNDIAKTFL